MEGRICPKASASGEVLVDTSKGRQVRDANAVYGCVPPLLLLSMNTLIFSGRVDRSESLLFRITHRSRAQLALGSRWNGESLLLHGGTSYQVGLEVM